jgi:molybdopterin/thiamine biosynthesis adenylyltransferase/rhodanese-related sulfurtransferase/proteasome lid subunit RPN8/RPN11/molybdopterin converting factor small subunit
VAVTLRQDVLTAIRSHGRETYPNECCGALIGADGVVTEAFALPNTTEEGPRRRFLVRPSDYQSAEVRATASGQELLGFYHSHPDHPAEPSQYDLDHAWPFFSYVIVSVREGDPRELRSWRLRDDRSTFDEEEVAMPVKVHIPTPLRPFTDKLDVIELDGTTIGELMSNLTTRFGGLKPHLFNEEGRLRSFVNVYVNDEDIRYLQKDQTPLKAGDTVSIIPSVAGGVGTAVSEPSGKAQAAPADLPVLSGDEIRRYSRHLILPEVGMDGQRRLKAAKVLCIGAGGLGSPAAMYLAAAGVGTIGIVDFDVVDLSNLQRQLLHSTPDVGHSKLESAKNRLLALNPNIHIETYEAALNSQNAFELFAPYDVVLDGTDNFPTRYLVNDACVILGKPNAYGSIFRFEGQASVFGTKEGPCYRCLYPEPPPPGLVPSCAEGGVLGVLPGIIGTIQATETIKLILGSGEPLIGRFLIYDALRMRFREVKVRRDPDCPVCGTHPTVTELIDYEQFCGVAPAAEAGVETITDDMTARELKERLDRGEPIVIVDVREPQEYQINRIAGSKLIPLGELPQRYQELDQNAAIVCQCKSGMRSAKATGFLRSIGFKNVRNLAGGILGWIDQVDPSQPKY